MPNTTDTSRRPRLAFLSLWGVPALLLADSFVAAATGWQPKGSIETALLTTLLCWLAFSCLWFVPGLRARLGRLWRELALLVIVATLGWTALEFTALHLETSLHPDKPFHTRGPNLRNTFYPDPAYLPGIEGESHFTTGPDGLRSAAPPTERQILRFIAVGGSTT